MIQVPKWQIVVVVAVVLLGLAFAAPNVFDRKQLEDLPDWVPSEQVNLGLDLRGGSYLLLEVDLEAVIEEQLEGLVDGIRTGLREARIGYSDLGVMERSATFTLRDPSKIEEARDIVRNQANGLLVDADGDTGRVVVSFTDQALQERTNNVLSQSIEIVRRRIDETGTREPSIQRQGDDRILVQLPGVDDPERIKDLLGQTAKLTFRMVEEGVQPGADRIPPGAEVIPSDEAAPDGEPVERFVVRKRVMVSGDTLVDAQATVQQGQPVVRFRFDSVGARRFGEATQRNVGRPFAIVLDGKVISAPVIREPILGGEGIISGNFTFESANDLAILLRAGALPAPLNILEERTVGPGLGADSIRAGETAAVLGLIFVIIFMAVIYGVFGVLANVALICNLVMLLGALSALQATLTLPGIAGIVLTLGMAVDANVLIFERIREEIRNGRSPVTGIDAGYRRAMTTIIDSNLTTLIAAIILFQFGSGPIKGFAVTLAIGLVTSMFTAIMVTRLLVIAWLRRGKPQQLAI
jgi:protein-export membrane protein SecD